MPSFTDTAGRKWALALNHALVMDIKKRVEVNVYKLLDDKLQPYLDLLADPEKLVQVVYIACEQQAKSLGVSPDDFGAALGGETLEALIEAWGEAVADFIPSQRQRLALREMGAKAKKVETLLTNRLTKALNDATPEAIAASLESTSRNGRLN